MGTLMNSDFIDNRQASGDKRIPHRVVVGWGGYDWGWNSAMKTTDTIATAKQPTTSTTNRCQPSLHDKYPSNPLDVTAGFVDYDKKAAL